jgi:hypothetical protein
MRQITIVTENRPGLTAEIADALGERGINIESLDAEAAGHHAVFTLIVDRYDVALQALRDAGLPAMSEDAILIRLSDEPGALARIARRFRDAKIDLRSLRILKRSEGFGLVAISTDERDRAIELVRDVLVQKPNEAEPK